MKAIIKKLLSVLLVTGILLCNASLSELTGFKLLILNDGFITKASAYSQASSGYYNGILYYVTDYYYTDDGEKVGYATIFRCDTAFHGSVVIPSVIEDLPVEIIATGAFKDCKYITDIYIPNSVTIIDYDAFYGCYSANISIPDSVKGIAKDTFFGVLNISYSRNLNAQGSPWGARNVNKFADGYLVYSDSGKKELIDCSEAATGNIEIPDSVEIICDKTFSNCTDVTGITVPNSVKRIGDYAFSGCKNLSNITIPDSVISIGKYSFDGCTNLTDIKISDYVDSIENGTFYGCCSLKKITLPDGLKSIGDSVFYNCSSLKNVILPENVEYIGYDAFSHSGLTSITIPESVKSIDDEAFWRCESLTGVIIPAGVQEIGDFVFWGCKALKSVTFSDGVKYIGDYMFAECIELRNVTIPNSVTYIGDGAFVYCSNLSSIKIPDSITDIGEGAFGYCTSLKEIIIPNSVEYIGDEAFAGCSELTSITIPRSVTSMGVKTFEECEKVTIRCYRDSYAHLYALHYGIKYILLDDVHEHSYTAAVTKEATCLEKGIMTYTCSCGSFYLEEIPLKEHNWSVWVRVSDPTADENGYDERYCSACHSKETKIIKALVNEETGVEIIYSNEFPDDTILEVSKVSDDTAFHIISADFGDDINTEIFEISTIKDGVKIQPAGTVTVRIPIPENYNGTKMTVVFVDNENNLTETIPCRIADGFVEFMVNHFSRYALVWEKAKITSVSINDINIKYKDSAKLNPVTKSDGEVKYKVEFSSSDNSIATVDNEGNVYGAKKWTKSTAVITCTVTDEYGNQVSDTCNVTVGFAWWQWIIGIVLLGFIWY